MFTKVYEQPYRVTTKCESQVLKLEGNVSQA